MHPRPRSVIAAMASVAAVAGLLVVAPAGVAQAFNGISTGGYTVRGDQATFPLRAGRTLRGETFWHIVVEASDSDSGDRFGVRAVSKLQNAAGSGAVQHGRLVEGVLVTEGTVDFAPEHRLPATPGSVADADYSPLVQLPSGAVINAPVLANATGWHDKVISLDTSARTVTLQLTEGFARDTTVRYLSTDASAAGPAALEESTLVRRLDDAPGLGDDSSASSRASLAAFVNGPTGADNPERQGISSALLGEGDPLNVLAWLPGQGRYSPLWDVHLTAWVESATPRRVVRFADVEDAARAGLVTAPDGSPWRASGAVVNCPILAVVD